MILVLATELGLAQVGCSETISLFLSNQFLRYWILQSQWKGFPDNESFSRRSSLSNRPGDTEVRRLSCRWSSVVSAGRGGSSIRFEELQSTRRPALDGAEQRQGRAAARIMRTAKLKPGSILLDEEKVILWFALFVFSSLQHKTRSSENPLEQVFTYSVRDLEKL